MGIEIYYFSGTGNSLHVARELQRRIANADLIPIVRCLSKEKVKSNTEKIGFVFPLFCLTIPIPLYNLLNKMDLSSAKYIFVICTRGGSFSQAFIFMNKLLKKQNKQINCQIHINMPWNIPLGKDINPGTISNEKVKQLEIDMNNKLDMISKCICTNADYIKQDLEITYPLPTMVKMLTALTPVASNYNLHRYMYQDKIVFVNTQKCKECGICKEVCLSNKIEIINNRPVWKEEAKCFACFACINFCPQQAIQIISKYPIKSFTEMNGRYHHYAIIYKDIAEQKGNDT